MVQIIPQRGRVSPPNIISSDVVLLNQLLSAN